MPAAPRSLFVLHAVVLAGAVAVSGTAQAATATPHGAARTATASYTGSGVDSVAVVPGVYGDISDAVAAVSFTPQTRERTLSLSVTDQLGRPVLAAVVQHLGPGNSDDDELGRLCGQPGTFHLPVAQAPVTVYLLSGTCNGGPSTPTTGTVTGRFTR